MALKQGVTILPSPLEKAVILRSGEPAGERLCLDDARRWLGCCAEKRARCNFFANGEKLAGCLTYPHNGTPFHLPKPQPLIGEPGYRRKKYGLPV